MNYKILTLLLLLLPGTVSAQKRRVTKKKRPAPVVVVEEPQEDPRITDMRAMTQQIVFIDSLVTDRHAFLDAIRLSSESGRLTLTSEFFSSLKSDTCLAFVNEMGNKMYFALPDRTGRNILYTSDKLGGTWSEASTLKGLNEGLANHNSPFVLADGTTLYFAAQGEESIGGYDLFLTRFDSRSGAYLKPENLGMPFNSEANDYLIAINERDSIGYFVTDRRQPEGKVCVYTFIPSESRRTYDPSKYTEEQIRAFADITRIADTWGDGKARKAALRRLNAQPSRNPQAADNNFTFVVNDRTTYTRQSDFRSKQSLSLFQQLRKKQDQLSSLNAQLEKSRTFYKKASPADRQALRKEILKAEDELPRLYSEIKSLEKRIRTLENAR